MRGSAAAFDQQPVGRLEDPPVGALIAGSTRPPWSLRAGPAVEELAPLVAASDRLREGLLNQVEADGTTCPIARLRRLVRRRRHGVLTVR